MLFKYGCFQRARAPILICSLFCTAFIGFFELLTSCSNCDSPRFTNRSDQIDSGTPLATISYRPLLSLFYESLRMKGFLPIFLHEYKKPSLTQNTNIWMLPTVLRTNICMLIRNGRKFQETLFR